MTLLEQILMKAHSRQSSQEYNLDVLYQVMIGEIGTDNQRNTLLRIIKANQPKSPLFNQTLDLLGEEIYNRDSPVKTMPLLREIT